MSKSDEITETDPTFFSSFKTSKTIVCSSNSIAKKKSLQNQIVFTPKSASRIQFAYTPIEIISFDELSKSPNSDISQNTPISLSKSTKTSDNSPLGCHSLDLFNKTYESWVNQIQNNKSLEWIKKRNSTIINRAKGNHRLDITDENNDRVSRRKNPVHKHIEELIKKTEEEINSFTNTVNISDFYAYTESCARIILKLREQENNGNSASTTSLPCVSFSLDGSKRIAIFDWDETLVHCTGETKTPFESTEKRKWVTVTLPSKKKVNIGINIRPCWKKALDIIKEHYNIIVYTASHQSYADAVLNAIDEKNEYFQNRLYRNNCVQEKVEEQVFYIKDLNIFKERYNWKDIVIVDNSILSFAKQIYNGIPIVPYYEQEDDNELMFLAGYLLKISDIEDLREANKKAVNMDAFIFEAEMELEREKKKKNGLNDSLDMSEDEEIIDIKDNNEDEEIVDVKDNINEDNINEGNNEETPNIKSKDLDTQTNTKNKSHLSLNIKTTDNKTRRLNYRHAKDNGKKGKKEMTIRILLNKC